MCRVCCPRQRLPSPHRRGTEGGGALSKYDGKYDVGKASSRAPTDLSGKSMLVVSGVLHGGWVGPPHPPAPALFLWPPTSEPLTLCQMKVLNHAEPTHTMLQGPYCNTGGMNPATIFMDELLLREGRPGRQHTICCVAFTWLALLGVAPPRHRAAGSRPRVPWWRLHRLQVTYSTRRRSTALSVSSARRLSPARWNRRRSSTIATRHSTPPSFAALVSSASSESPSTPIMAVPAWMPAPRASCTRSSLPRTRPSACLTWPTRSSSSTTWRATATLSRWNGFCLAHVPESSSVRLLLCVCACVPVRGVRSCVHLCESGSFLVVAVCVGGMPAIDATCQDMHARTCTHTYMHMRHISDLHAVRGRVAGGMCMSEPSAGTDVLAMTTKAQRQADGTYVH